MNTTSKLLQRKIFKQLPIFFSAVFIVVLSVIFFVAVKTVYLDFKKYGEKYFKNNKLNDIMLTGMYSKEDIEEIENIDGVDIAELKYRYLGNIEIDTNIETEAMLYSTDNKDIRVDKPYVYEGKEKLLTNEIAISKNYAKEYNLKLGDEVKILVDDNTNTFKIASLVSYPNYVFLFKDMASSASKVGDLAVVEMNEYFFETNNLIKNTIVVRYNENANTEKVENAILDKLEKKTFYFTTKHQSRNFSNYKQTLGQIDAFSYICPIILLAMAALLLYVIQRRNVAVERKQIGIMKALGLNDFGILFMYIKYSFLIVIFALAISIVILRLALPPVFNSLKALFDIPEYWFNNYPALWVIALSIVLVISILSNLIAAESILKLNPTSSMRGEAPKGGKKIFFENSKWWLKRSFNTRYAVKNSFRGKTRYIASLWGMFVAITMTMFAQGFNNSFTYFIDSLYNRFARYDVSVSINGLPWRYSPNFLNDKTLVADKIIKHYDKAAIYQARVSKPFQGDESKIDIPVLIYNSSFTSLNIPIVENKGEGVLISKSIANRLNVKKGDYIGLDIFMFGRSQYKRVRINALVEQPGMFFVYMERKFAKDNFNIDDIYNTIYMRVSDLDLASDILSSNKEVASYSLKKIEEDSSKEQIATVALLVQILIVIAFLLGAISLYGVGLVTLATRRYEFTLLKVMGYSTKEIMLASTKETLSQIILAIPLGILAGYGILYLVRDSFSNEFFDFIPYIYPISYVYAIVLLFATIVSVSILSARFISRLDMVEGLKEREE